MIRAVIDTNVLVSAMLSPSGNEALVLLGVIQGLVHPCLSQSIIDEYQSVLERPKFSFPPAAIDQLIVTLRTKGEIFHPRVFSSVSPDPADTKFLHCALAANADFIVTGNKRDFPDAPYGTIRVVSAGELLDRITTELQRTAIVSSHPDTHAPRKPKALEHFAEASPDALPSIPRLRPVWVEKDRCHHHKARTPPP